MAERQKDPCRVTLKNVRLSFANLYKAKAFGGDKDAEPQFSSNFLMDPDDKMGAKNIALIEDAIEAAKEAKWKGKPPKIPAAKICLRDGNDMEFDGYEGMMYLSSNNPKKPRVLDRDKQDVLEGDEDAPYSGCFVDAIVRIWAMDNKWGKRVNASVEAVRFREDGEAFGAAPVDLDEFDDLDEDDGPSRRRKSSAKREDDDEDEKPARRSSSRRPSRDDDEDDEKPARRSSSRRSSRDDDEEDEKPARRRATRDDDEDERPARRSSSRRPSRDDDEDEEKPARRRASRDEDDDEDRPSRNSRSRRRSDDDDVV